MDGNHQERRPIDFEVGTGRRNRACNLDVGAVGGAVQWHVIVVNRLTGELNLKIGIDSRRVERRLREVCAHDHHGKLRAAHRLHHVQIAIAVAGVEGLQRDRNQEVATCGAAIALAFGVVTGAIDFMHGMRDVPGERGLHENPLAVLGHNRQRQRDQQQDDGRPHRFSQNFR